MKKVDKKQTIPLLQEYKKYPSLWDPTDKNYKNHYDREKNLKKIIENLALDMSVGQLRTRIKNLRQTYVREVNRIDESIRAGAKIRKPRLAWFDVADSFLGTVVLPRIGSDDMDSFCYESQNSEDSEASTEKVEQVIVHPAKLHPVFVEEKDIKPESLEDENNDDEYVLYEEGMMQDEDANQNRNELPTIQAVRSEKVQGFVQEQPLPSSEDEFDTFGRHIANILRSLPLREAIKSQDYIHNYLAQERLKILERGGPSGSNKLG